MPNTAPLEILNPLYSIYWAAVGTTFPLIDAEPSEDWTLIGTGGLLNYGEEGITVDMPQSIDYFRSVGDSAPRKGFRNTEDAKFRIVLVDMTLENWRHAVNRNSVTTTAAGVGTAGFKSIEGSRGLHVDTVALLLRAETSPYMENGNSQFQVWRAQQTGSPSPVSVRNSPASLALEWTALVDPSNGLWRYLAQTAAAQS